MRIINESHWNSDHIRRLVKIVVNEVGTDPELVKSITIVTGKGTNRRNILNQYGGRAFHFSQSIRMGVPKLVCDEIIMGSDGSSERIRKDVVFNPVVFAQVLTHELQHLMGNRGHRDMIRWWTYDCDYVKDFVVERRGLT